MRVNPRAIVATIAIGLLAAPVGRAQEAVPEMTTETPPAPAAPAAETAKKEPPPYRPIEGQVIINLPSVDVPAKGTLTMQFTHRFQQPVQDSNFNDLFSFDSGANIGIGLGYAPLKGLNFSFYRYSNFNKTYQFGAKYALLSDRPFAVSLAAGGDVRTAPDLNNRSTFYAQAILAYTFGPWARITVVPTYLNHTSGQDAYFYGSSVGDLPATFLVVPEPFYPNVFNVPIAASIAITHSITIHGEVVPSFGRTVLVTQTQGCGIVDLPPCPPTVAQRSSPGVGWVVSIEKALLRHRFAFTAGNMRETTIDQYLLPNFLGFPKNIYLGFNIMRQWELK